METFIDDGEILAASEFRRVPRHIGLIPDGNRRWARERGLHPALGYQAGVEKGLEMLEHCRTLGVEEVSVYGFTTDNTKRPVDQRLAFSQACVDFASTVISRGGSAFVWSATLRLQFSHKSLSHYAVSHKATDR